MNKKWQFLFKLMAPLIIALVASSAYAIPKGPCNEKPEVCCEEPHSGPFAFCYAKDMDLACPQDFYLNVEFLVMQPKLEGLEYAVTQTNTDNSNGLVFPLSGGNMQGFSTGSHDWDWDFAKYKKGQPFGSIPGRFKDSLFFNPVDSCFDLEVDYWTGVHSVFSRTGYDW